MRKIITSLALLTSVAFFGQNIFPTSGNVGIGTDSPFQELQIVTENEGINYLMHLGGKTHLSGNAFGIGFNPEGWHNAYGNRIKTAIVVEGNNTGWSRGNLHILQNNNKDMTPATLDDSVFTVSSTGNVGIGTPSPNAKLELYGKGNLLFKGSDNDAGDVIFQTNSSSQLGRIWTNTDGSSGMFLSSGDNSPDLTISSTGNVGIGTSNPNSKLELYGKGNLLFKGSDNDAGDVIFQTNSSSQLGRIWTNTDGSSGMFLSSGDNSPDLTISSTGNIGIGTRNPDSKLTVKGKIHCEEVKVDVAVPADYVFEKYYTGVSKLKAEYTMPTLEEVETYTKENHHLPNIPSAAEIKEEGLHLKEMTNLLLQKVEELTLYTIEQNKINIEQSKTIKLLEEKITDLK